MTESIEERPRPKPSPEIVTRMRFDQTKIYNKNVSDVVMSYPELQAHFNRMAKEIQKRDTNGVKVRINIRTTIEELEEE